MGMLDEDLLGAELLHVPFYDVVFISTIAIWVVLEPRYRLLCTPAVLFIATLILRFWIGIKPEMNLLYIREIKGKIIGRKNWGNWSTLLVWGFLQLQDMRD